ncbi:MAG: non-canonical purine NTP pyrophosphatase [Patescibacteria group bacterium]|jgi:XTP/dITP diphosphohydrolase
MKILLATHNPAKIQSYRQKLGKIGVEFCTLDDLGIKEKYQEIGNTFEENARDKTLFYYNLSQMPTLGDDGGFEIDYFNGEPGVKSKRWLGYEASDEELVNHLKKIIPTIPIDQRSARFVAVSCLVNNPEQIHLFKNTKEGYITNDIRDDYPVGFPYRCCFVSSDFNKHVQDLTESEREAISHRLKNLESLKQYLLN